jgi:hypothetical protein
MTMTTNAKTVVEWTYVPKGLFEVPCQLTFEGGQIEIADGDVRGEFDASCYGQGRDFHDRVHTHVGTVFMAQQVQVCQCFTLSEASMALEHADGRRDVTIFGVSFSSKSSFGRVDSIVTNANGAVTQDTRADRLQQQQNFRDNVATMTDDLFLKRMLQSYGNALSDHDNFLIHLSEIREAFTLNFGTAKDDYWRGFGKLANDDPVQEGRHRGKHTGLRPATELETERALSFARRQIKKYVAAKVSDSSTET